jgi:hypothetical protein
MTLFESSEGKENNRFPSEKQKLPTEEKEAEKWKDGIPEWSGHFIGQFIAVGIDCSCCQLPMEIVAAEIGCCGRSSPRNQNRTRMGASRCHAHAA